MDNGYGSASFEPTTDFPESIDSDDTAISGGTSSHDATIQRKRRTIVRVVAVASVVLLLLAGFGPLRTVVAVVVAYALFMTGVKTIGAFARPIPAPLPPGELRRVKLTYRCEVCGTELRLTLANDQVPEPPKHCTEPMVLTTNLEDVL